MNIIRCLKHIGIFIPIISISICLGNVRSNEKYLCVQNDLPYCFNFNIANLRNIKNNLLEIVLSNRILFYYCKRVNHDVRQYII